MTISVKITTPKKRTFILAQWSDPITGRIKTQSTKTANRKEALKYAARLENDLNAGDYRPPDKTTWKEFRERYEDEVGAGVAEATLAKARATFNAFEELIDPKYLNVVSASVISKFAGALRKRAKENNKTISEFTVHGHLAELRKSLNWAADIGLIAKPPKIKFPQRVGGMKGRPITGEELDRFLAAIPKVVKIPEFVDSWIYLAQGLWWSGLRLSEAMLLHWTDDEFLCPDFTGKPPMFRIQAEAEKGRQFRMLPMAPEFARFLERTPPRERHGLVFNPLTRPRSFRTSGVHRPTTGHAGKVMTKIGTSAGIAVNKTKDASAHDFRRAFGHRWALRVYPKVLQELMRHASIQTTMQYYVGQMATEAADAVWDAELTAAANTFTNTSPDSPVSEPAEKLETTTNQA